MRGRAIIPMVVGLAVGLVALKVFVNVLQKAKGATTELVPVVYAATNIEPTLELKESMIEVRHVSKEAVPETGFRDKSEVIGRVTAWPVPKGTPIGAMQLAPKGTPAGMAVMIQEGFRAVAVKIDESAGVAGWIKPGSHVDVIALLSNTDRSSKNQNISRVILQNIQVLAVGQEIGKAGDTAASVTNTVTLLVSPNDVPKLHLAETKGKLRLAMRGQDDTSFAKDYQTTDNDLLGNGLAANSVNTPGNSSIIRALFGGQAKLDPDQTDKEHQPELIHASAQPAPAAPQSWTVELYKGPDAVEAVKFEQGKTADQWQRTQESRATPAPRAPEPQQQHPKSLFAPRPVAPAPADAANAKQPQATGSATGGPAGAH